MQGTPGEPLGINVLSFSEQKSMGKGSFSCIVKDAWCSNFMFFFLNKDWYFCTGQYVRYGFGIKGYLYMVVTGKGARILFVKKRFLFYKEVIDLGWQFHMLQVSIYENEIWDPTWEWQHIYMYEWPLHSQSLQTIIGIMVCWHCRLIRMLFESVPHASNTL